MLIHQSHTALDLGEEIVMTEEYIEALYSHEPLICINGVITNFLARTQEKKKHETHYSISCRLKCCDVKSQQASVADPSRIYARYVVLRNM